MNNLIDLSGKKYGRLLVVSFHHAKNGRTYWLCKCDCGNRVVLRNDCFAYPYSKQKSCGCLRREVSSARMKNILKERYEVSNENAE